METKAGTEVCFVVLLGSVETFWFEKLIRGLEFMLKKTSVADWRELHYFINVD